MIASPLKGVCDTVENDNYPRNTDTYIPSINFGRAPRLSRIGLSLAVWDFAAAGQGALSWLAVEF